MPSQWRRIRNLVVTRLRSAAAEASGAPERDAVDADFAESEPPPRERPPADPPQDERTRALSILELDRGATRRQIRGAYRRLCRRYHPDRFANDTAKSRTATELLIEINRAYEILTEG